MPIGGNPADEERVMLNDGLVLGRAHLLVVREDKGMLCLREMNSSCPVPQFRNRLCMWGGAQEKNEDARACVERKMVEELAEPIVTLLLTSLRHTQEKRIYEPIVTRFPNPGQGSIEQTVLPVVVARHQWPTLVRATKEPSAVREGLPAFRSEEVVRQATPRDFLPGQHEAILRFLLSHSSDRV